MKLVHPEINGVFDFDSGVLNTLIIENQGFLYRFLSDIVMQINGENGKSILSENDAPVNVSGNVEVIDSFADFSLNRKNVLSKLASSIENSASDAKNYETTMSVLGEVERYLNQISRDLPFDVAFPKLSVASIIKAASPEICDDAETLSEKILNYIEIVYELDKPKLIVIVNMRSFACDEEAELFARTVIPHGYRILMVESAERKKLPFEKRIIIDGDLCEIS